MGSFYSFIILTINIRVGDNDVLRMAVVVTVVDLSRAGLKQCQHSFRHICWLYLSLGLLCSTLSLLL